MCLYPKFILNRKYLPNKKNKGIVPQITDERVRYVPIGCGKCMECKKQRKRNWQVRLQEELRTDNKGKFVTLSYSEESLTKLQNEITENDKRIQGYLLDNETATLSIRRFLERWRKKTGKSVKHWLVTELGQNNTERIHIHGIIFTNDIKAIKEIWTYGNTWIGDYVNEKTVNYIVKYINKTDIKHENYNPKILTSKAIGRNYINRPDSKLNKFNNKETKEYYYTRQGIKLPLPIYYRNKIYKDEEKEELWLNLLNKNIRYINGIKVDISKNEDDYWNVLKEARILNRTLGYGTDEKDWNKIKYEQDRRNLKRLQRINKAVDVYRDPMIANKKYIRIKATQEINKYTIDETTGEMIMKC